MTLRADGKKILCAECGCEPKKCPAGEKCTEEQCYCATVDAFWHDEKVGTKNG